MESLSVNRALTADTCPVISDIQATPDGANIADPFSEGSAIAPAATAGCPVQHSQPALVRQESKRQSIYEKLGGKEAVTAAVDKFYTKVLADDRVNSFFNGVDMKTQRAKQLSFICYAFGGPEAWKGKSMYEAHQHLNLTETHFTAIAEAFIATLQELSVPQELIDEAVGVVAGAKPQVLGLENPEAATAAPA